jgi:phosphocarrier protein HPr
MLIKTATIKNKLGIHARPASLFVKTASRFKSSIFVSKDGFEVNGKSIMGVLTLEGSCGSTLTLRINGDDEKEAMNALLELIEVRLFDEE